MPAPNARAIIVSRTKPKMRDTIVRLPTLAKAPNKFMYFPYLSFSPSENPASSNTAAAANAAVSFFNSRCKAWNLVPMRPRLQGGHTSLPRPAPVFQGRHRVAAARERRLYPTKYWAKPTCGTLIFVFHIRISQRRNFVADDHRPFAQSHFQSRRTAGDQYHVGSGANRIRLLVGQRNRKDCELRLRQNFANAFARCNRGHRQQKLCLRITFQQQ